MVSQVSAETSPPSAGANPPGVPTTTITLDVNGSPFTDKLKLTERFTRLNYGTLRIDITVDDPKAYTKAWTTTFKLSLAINTDLLEYVCNENEKSLQHMVGPTAAK